MDIKRKNAASLIQELAMYVAREIHGPGQPPSRWAEDMQNILTAANVAIPRPCPGQAHLPEIGGRIDNCMVCLGGDWGWVQEPIKVK
jgi:hypothetical protein